MDYFYATMWFIVGLILIFSISKENKVFYIAGGFFLLLGTWWLVNALLPEQDLFAGGWGIALRCIAAAALVVLTVFFLRERRRNIQREEQESPSGKKDKK